MIFSFLILRFSQVRLIKDSLHAHHSVQVNKNLVRWDLLKKT